MVRSRYVALKPQTPRPACRLEQKHPKQRTHAGSTIEIKATLTRLRPIPKPRRNALTLGIGDLREVADGHVARSDGLGDFRRVGQDLLAVFQHYTFERLRKADLGWLRSVARHTALSDNHLHFREAGELARAVSGRTGRQCDRHAFANWRYCFARSEVASLRKG